MRIKSIIDESIAFRKGIKPEDDLLKINDHPINDQIDYRYYSAEDELRLVIQERKKTIKLVRISKQPDEDLGIEFCDEKYRKCKNNCIFCFVHQLPAGLRRALYFKDEDFRLSFLHGNFITLTNTSNEDIQRIIDQRLSPLYISVHTTDASLRKRMLGNPRISDIIPIIRRLAAAKIEMHTQIVLCPGINDGEHLARSVGDLSSFYPHVKSLALVPVGLTRFRDRLPEIKPVSKGYSREIINLTNAWQKGFRKRWDCGFVYAADEFYTQAGLDIPAKRYYDEFPQVENGVGMMRQFVDTFKAKQRLLPKKLNRRLGITLVTGVSAFRMIQDIIDIRVASISGLSIYPVVVKNDFFGHSVTVTGLLAGKDILRTLKRDKKSHDIILLPPNCVNTEELFLDDITLTYLERILNRRVILGSYDLVQSILQVLKLHVKSAI